MGPLVPSCLALDTVVKLSKSTNVKHGQRRPATYSVADSGAGELGGLKQDADAYFCSTLVKYEARDADETQLSG